MPSGLADDVVNRVIDKIIGSGADTSLMATTLYLDGLTEEAEDDNGTGAVSWGQGRTEVDPTDTAVWPDDADGRQKTSAQITMETNSSGSTITLVALAWYDDPTAGNYLGGGPVPDGSLDVPDGTAPVVTATLAGPPPS